MISTSCVLFFFFFSSRRRHTRLQGDWSSDVCSSDLHPVVLLGMSTPEEYDGMGLDTLTYLLALEELAAADASIAVSVSIHNAIPATMLLRHGDSRQKERWLKPMARGELLAGFALSEPESGSDAASLSARALRAGDQWVLSGTKAWEIGRAHV